MPAALAGADQPYFEFCRAIIDATAPYVAAFKPQFAHFAAAGREVELARVIHYARERWPDHVVILDAKRGDIGSTAAFYAKEAYERYRAHAVTINPYLGEESVRPFLDYEDGGVVVLCRTSNPDSDWLQAHGLPPVHLRVAERVMQWNTSGQCMLVTGATYPEELAEIRAAAPTVPFLVPGIGAQGGDVAEVVANGRTEHGSGLLLSSSRAVIYADQGPQFATAAAQQAEILRDEINKLRDAL